LELGDERGGPVGPSDQPADDEDHLQDLFDAALVEQHDGVAAPGEIGGDVALQVGEGEDQIRIECFDLFVAGVRERRDARFAARLGRPDGIARHADHALALAEQVERLGRFFGEADDAARIAIGHAGTKSRHENGGLVTATPVSRGIGEWNIGPA
jgi:hypothetical protein